MASANPTYWGYWGPKTFLWLKCTKFLNICNFRRKRRCCFFFCCCTLPPLFLRGLGNAVHAVRTLCKVLQHIITAMHVIWDSAP